MDYALLGHQMYLWWKKEFSKNNVKLAVGTENYLSTFENMVFLSSQGIPYILGFNEVESRDRFFINSPGVTAGFKENFSRALEENLTKLTTQSRLVYAGFFDNYSVSYERKSYGPEKYEGLTVSAGIKNIPDVADKTDKFFDYCRTYFLSPIHHLRTQKA